MLFALSCSISENEVEPESSFLRVYNDESFENSFRPIDMIQTPDSGYFVLGAYDANKVYLLKADALGNFEWEYKMDPESFANPIPGMYLEDGSIFFYCSNQVYLDAYLMEIGLNSQEPQVSLTFNTDYPLFATRTAEGDHLILGYNSADIASIVDKFQPTGAGIWSHEYPVEEEVITVLLKHLNGVERLPFFIGTSTSHYHFNGFSNYTLSVHFINPGNGDLTGRINGFRSEKETISGLKHISGSDYSVTRYNFGANFFYPRYTLNENEMNFQTTDMVGGSEHPELVNNAYVNLGNVVVNGETMVAFSSTTRTGQILLYLYNENSGVLRGSKRLGIANQYEAIKTIQTSDGGIAVLGNTYATGRFSRICIFKFSEEELNALIMTESE